MEKKSPKGEELVKIINYNCNRISYYNRLLSLCKSDNEFESMINNISIKEIKDDKKNNAYYLKCKNDDKFIVVGSFKSDSDLTMHDLSDLAIPMTHYHVSKNNFIQDNFFHKITDEENISTLKLIQQLKLIDEKIKNLISEYIKNIDDTSPIANLIKKNNVKYDQNWKYNGIINKINDIEYINFHYFKKSFNKRTKIGTNIYYDNTYSKEIDELLSKNTDFCIYGNIYPIIKINHVVVNEKNDNGKKIVCFTCKAYFNDINFSSIYCNNK
ncbi:hypothetical protein BCR36DRAFT_348623 [Piromyces finnis]|uniref:Uncharacterized protein n=1 Tax=Piromyces finnis TaxID=1754191 RepID=A0A1Y1VET0_9FUNG|nr:hypothetical protein BCR36DRAFT_348623 [Piromyces finnis]|eukprot:ORX53733.1 hypothetical protein BCR36DRAFT_348623 [Piromyces finnis]